jgi:hypothetical protein
MRRKRQSFRAGLPVPGRTLVPVLVLVLRCGLALALLACCRSNGSDAEPTKAPNAVQNLIVGDTKVETLTHYQGPEPLPKPKQTLVYDFEVPAETITMDESVGARLHRHRLRLLQSSEDDSSPEVVAKQVRASFSKTLVAELQKTQVPTQVAETGTHAPQHVLLVQGNFTAVNEGNRSKRIMVGLGRGASDVCAHVKVSLTTDKQPVVLSEFNLNSESGKKPGAAEGMGVSRAATSAAAGGAGGVAAGSVGDAKASVEADATRMAQAVARQIEQLMIAQKWVSSPQPAAK